MEVQKERKQMSVWLCILNWSLSIDVGRYKGIYLLFRRDIGVILHLGCLSVSLIWDNRQAVTVVDAAQRKANS